MPKLSKKQLFNVLLSLVLLSLVSILIMSVQAHAASTSNPVSYPGSYTVSSGWEWLFNGSMSYQMINNGDGFQITLNQRSNIWRYGTGVEMNIVIYDYPINSWKVILDEMAQAITSRENTPFLNQRRLNR